MLALLAALALAMILVPAAAAGNKTMGCTTITPASVPAGSSTSFVLALCNDATSPNQLGSANFFAPAGFVITDAKLCSDPGCAIKTPLPAGSSTSFPIPSGNGLVLRNLGIAAGSTKYFSILATAPCSGSNLQWSIYAKQSNDFNGPPGNSFSPYPATFPVTLTGICQLHFSVTPGETAGLTKIRNTKWGSLQNPPTTDAVQVDVLSNGNHLASPSGTVAISATGPGCTLTGGGSAIPFDANGYATFPDLTVANVASPASCVLTATSSGYGSIASGFTVDPTKLYFVNQPASAVFNTVVTNKVNGGTVNPVQGDPITVGVEATDGGPNPLPFSGTGTVTMTSSGPNCAFTNDSTFQNVLVDQDGKWRFSNLKMKNAPTTCQLQAVGSSVGYDDSDASHSFDVGQFGTYCLDPNNCSLPNSPDNKQFSNSASVANAGAQDITLNYTDLATLLGNTPCSSLIAEYTDKQGNTPTGLVLGFDAALSFQGTPGTTVQHTINKHWVQIFPNNGNPFIDLCAGAVRVDRFGTYPPLFTPGTPLPCDPATGKDATGLGGWITKDGTPAVCVGGMFWGIQGHTGIPASDPQVTAVTGDQQGNRTFTISLGTVPAVQQWYWDYKNGP